VIYTRADLTATEAEELELRYGEWKERYGGLPSLEEHIVCKLLQCTAAQLEKLSVRKLIEVEERTNAGRGITGSTYLERWACRWIKEREA